MADVMLVMALICALPLMFAALGQAATVGAAAVVIVHSNRTTSWPGLRHVGRGKCIRQSGCRDYAAGAAVDHTRRRGQPQPAGSVSVKLNVCEGLPVGCEITNDIVCVPVTGIPPPKVLLKDGTAALTDTQAPVVLVPPPAAVLATETDTLVVP